MALEVNGTQVAKDGHWTNQWRNLTIHVQSSVKSKTNDAELQVQTSKAHKLGTEKARILGVHLDTTWLHFVPGKCAGVLPEIWGLRPKSAMTKAMMEGPVLEVQA